MGKEKLAPAVKVDAEQICKQCYSGFISREHIDSTTKFLRELYIVTDSSWIYLEVIKFLANKLDGGGGGFSESWHFWAIMKFSIYKTPFIWNEQWKEN